MNKVIVVCGDYVVIICVVSHSGAVILSAHTRFSISTQNQCLQKTRQIDNDVVRGCILHFV